MESAIENFEVIATRSSQLVLVDIWADWCAPCRLVAPAVEQTARELAGRLKVVNVHADRAPGVAQRFNVQGISTLLFLRGGKEVDRIVGAVSTDALLAGVQANLEPGPHAA